MNDDVSGLTHLGSGATEYPNEYDRGLLESFPAPLDGPIVELNCPEFTSLCPRTGQPDFATITIWYLPGMVMVESKSLKLYLFSFRNHPTFHESAVQTILKDLVTLLSPQWMLVRGDFGARGGISLRPTAAYETIAKIPDWMHYTAAVWGKIQP